MVSGEIHVEASARRLKTLLTPGHAIVRALSGFFRKIFIQTESHGLARRRMGKTYGRGAQAQPAAGMAVQSVARDGASQSVLMGAVHPQLMRTTGLRI